MAEERIRVHFGDYLSKAEVVIYSILAVLLFITALATIANATKMLWEGLAQWTIASETLLVLDQLLVVLMLVEVLHTVRDLYSLALLGYRTVSCGRANCLDSAGPCDYVGSGYPNKRWNVVDRG